MQSNICIPQMLPRDVICARSTRNGSYVRNRKNKIRSMVSGRFYKNKRAILASDRALVRFYNSGPEAMAHMTAIGVIGRETPRNILRGDELINFNDVRNNPLRVLHQRKIMEQVWANENQNYAQSGMRRGKRGPTIHTKNGVQIAQLVEKDRVSPGEEHLLQGTVITGVQYQSRRVIF